MPQRYNTIEEIKRLDALRQGFGRDKGTKPHSDPYTAVQQNTAPPNPNSLPTGGTLQKTMRL